MDNMDKNTAEIIERIVTEREKLRQELTEERETTAYLMGLIEEGNERIKTLCKALMDLKDQKK